MVKSVRLIALIAMQLGGITFCNAQLFTEVSDQLGLNYDYPGISNLQIGGGVTVIDFNKDGWDDIFQAGGLFKSKLWLNTKGKFSDVSAENNLEVLDGMYVNGAVAGDINNDGYEDLFIYNYGEGLGNGDHRSPILLVNHKGRLERSTNANFSEKGFFTSASMADYNQDGYLDIYVTNYVSNMSLLEDSLNKPIGYNPVGLPNKFYINQKDGTFKESAAMLYVNEAGCGLACCFTDFDNDCDMDLMVANDFGSWTKKGNVLFENESSFFLYANKSLASNFYHEMYGMSIAVGDYDNDNDLDYFISNIGKNILLQNDSNKQFIDKTDEAKLDRAIVNDSLPGTAWSALFFDMDNDMDLDLYIAKGNVENYIPKAVVLDPNQLYQNNGDGTFVDFSDSSGLNSVLSHRGAALLDVDHDGDLDIVSSPVKINYGAFSNLSQKIKLYRNNSTLRSNWINIILVDHSELKESPIGKHVYLKCANVLQMREVDGGSAHASQSSKVIHFGLGKSNKADLITIKWDAQNTINIANLAANKTYLVCKDGTYKEFTKGTY